MPQHWPRPVNDQCHCTCCSGDWGPSTGCTAHKTAKLSFPGCGACRLHAWSACAACIYEETVTQLPAPVAPPPPPHHQHPDVDLTLKGTTKRKTSAPALHQMAACKLQEQLEGHLLVFPNDSVLQSVPAAAPCIVTALGRRRQCRRSFTASSTAAELAGLHLVSDLLAERPPQQWWR